MIELNDIIEAAEKLLDNKNCTLVLHRNMKVHPKFKVYKIFEYKLYSYNSISKDKTVLLDESYTINTPSDDIISTWNNCDKKFLTILIEWFTSRDFKS